MTERTIYVAVTPEMRRVLVAITENLIAMLDQIDGDETLEDVGDLEPSLGWTDRGPSALANSLQDDREAEDEHGGDIQDEPHDQFDEGHDEPWLGWGTFGSQGPRCDGTLATERRVWRGTNGPDCEV